MSEFSVRLSNLGKKYRLHRRPADKVFDALGMRWLPGVNNGQDFWALRDTNLTFRKGERVGIIGRNGAGKSTLLKLICGIVNPTEGNVDVVGRIQALMELGTGFHPEFTGRENVRSALAYQGLSAKDIAGKVDEIVDFSELDAFIDQPVRTYSAGMYARLAFAAATAVEPEVLIIDEILGAGDAYFAGKCLERMRALTEKSGATVLFVSHDLSSVQRLCPRAVWIDRGRVKRDGESLDVIKEYAAIVRAEEELRLRARDMKVRKGHAGSIEAQGDVYRELLCHLVPANGKPLTARVPVYHIRLMRDNEEIGAITPGGAMDNAADYGNALLTDTGYMDWGEPRVDPRGRPYREYGNFGGKFAHAPFRLAVPRTFDLPHEAADWRLEIDADTDEPVAVEIYRTEAGVYQRLGILKKGIPTTALPLQWAELLSGAIAPTPDTTATTEPAADASPAPKNVHEYGTGEARIITVKMYNSVNQESRVFEMGKPMRIELEYDARQPLNNPLFVFCAYLPDGQCASQWGVNSHELGAETLAGRGRVVFRLPTLHLGRSAYVASAAIFKHQREDGMEAESYHVLDRCIHFQVMQESGQAMSRGLCLQPFEAEIKCG